MWQLKCAMNENGKPSGCHPHVTKSTSFHPCKKHSVLPMRTSTSTLTKTCWHYQYKSTSAMQYSTGCLRWFHLNQNETKTHKLKTFEERLLRPYPQGKGSLKSLFIPCWLLKTYVRTYLKCYHVKTFNLERAERKRISGIMMEARNVVS